MASSPLAVASPQKDSGSLSNSGTKRRRKIIFESFQSFSLLSNELITTIFKYVATDSKGKFLPKDLFKCSLVCKHWNHLAFDVFLPIFHKVAQSELEEDIELISQAFVGMTIFWTMQERVNFLFKTQMSEELLHHISFVFSLLLAPEEGARLIQLCVHNASLVPRSQQDKLHIPVVMLKNYLTYKSFKDESLVKFWESLFRFEALSTKKTNTDDDDDEVLLVSDRILELIAKIVDMFMKGPTNQSLKLLSPIFTNWDVAEIAPFCTKLLFACSFDKGSSSEELSLFYQGITTTFPTVKAANFMAKISEDMALIDRVKLIFSMKIIPLVADASFLYATQVPETQIEDIVHFLEDYCGNFTLSVRVQFMDVFCEKLEPYLLRLSTLISKEQLCKILLKFVIVGWRNL